jgi:hypothetical protein
MLVERTVVLRFRVVYRIVLGQKLVVEHSLSLVW